jgi:hypothetical protein
VTNGFLFFRLKPLNERPSLDQTPLPMLPMVQIPTYRAKSAQEIVQQLFPQLISIPGVLAFVINPPSLGGQFSSTPVQYVLQASDYQVLGQAVGAMMAEGQKLGYLVNMDTDLRLNTPQLDITIDRDRAAQLGVSVTDIGSTLETLLGGKAISDFKRGTKQYDVIAQLKPTAAPRRRPSRDLSPGGERSRSARECHQHQGDGGAQGAQPLQPAALGHHHGEPRARRQPRTGLGRSGPDLGHGAPRGRQARAGGAVEGVPRVEQQPLSPLRLGGRLHLPRARGAVRELHPSAHDSLLGAAAVVRP